MNSKRELKMDIMKVIGLFAIILAHVSPHEIIFQIRNFDVPLMVFVSGYLSYNSYKSSKSYFSYVIKRIKRLLIPTWIFLTIYFFIVYICHNYFNVQFYYSKNQMIDSYLLLEGIGYIWIVRVYLLVELVMPLFIKIVDSFKKYIVFIIIISLFIINELMCHYNIYNINMFTNYYLSNLISYGTILLLGLFVRKLNKKEIKYLLLLFIMIFTAYVLYFFKTEGLFVFTQTRKYPPSLYYLSYSLIVSLLLFLIEPKIKNIKLNNIIVSISKNSFWIYLWHILAIYIVSIIKPDIHWTLRKKECNKSVNLIILQD